tara:strand:- start:2493 stop:2681 length:189 start_codon:yes stop_codon:yes gene_type:complete
MDNKSKILNNYNNYNYYIDYMKPCKMIYMISGKKYYCPLCVKKYPEKIKKIEKINNKITSIQ